VTEMEGLMTSGSSGRYKEWVDFLFKPENIDELPVAGSDTRRSSFFSGLLNTESLPFDEPGSGGRLSNPGTSVLLASEPLAFDVPPKSPHGRASLFSTLFSREALPEDPVPGFDSADRGQGR
jgi:hypothetical protein